MATKPTTISKQVQKAVEVQTSGTMGQRLLGFLLKALGTKTNGLEAAAIGSAFAEARDMLPAGDFNVTGTVTFSAQGNIGVDTTAPKPYGFKWIEMLSMALAYAGVTRDAARRMLAAMVQAQRDKMAFEAAKLAAAEATRVSGTDAAEVEMVYNATTYELTDGTEQTITAKDVQKLAETATARIEEIEADAEQFARTLMVMRPQRGAIKFTSVNIMAQAVEPEAAQRQVA